MNRKTLLIAALAGLSALLLLTACNGDKNPEDSGTSSDTTGASTEAATAPPRYDYMDAVVAPDVTIDKADYTGLTLTIPDAYRITEEDVKDYVENIRFQYRTAVNGTNTVKDKALALGDDAFIYYKGYVDGKEFDGGSNWDDEKPYQLGLGSGSFIPGFEEALVGIVPNQTSKDNPAEIQVTFPEDYNEELAGKDATFKIVVSYSVQYTVAEYNREFVETTLQYEPQKDFYASDAALLSEFEDYLFDYLTKQNATNVENAKLDALWNHLTEKATCVNLPKLEVDHYFNSYKAEAEYYYNYYKNSGGEEFTKVYPDLGSFAVVYFGMEKGADWEAEFTRMAELMVKKDMIAHAIAEAEGLETVTEEEYKAQIQYWVDYYYGYMTEADIIQNMGETYLKEAAFAEKMDAWLMKQATFTYEDGTPLVSTTENETETDTTEG